MHILPAALMSLTVAALVVPSVAEAQRRWRTVGYMTVSRGSDRDTIRLRGNARDRQIRVCAINRAINFTRLSVRFENGGRQELPVRRVLNAGTCTPAQDLRGQRRNIAAVDMTYSRFARGTLPLIRVQAR
ncbi:hypothetical protein RCO27_12740 [Sphingosinicella sp. LHD-64]|uniref:hypothetical protein n=1 Tax=Sphingosinicella sp. LHD-64 TaxID=3072139 RepID=UPI00280EB7E6|nr:hypothetical protein [Sphingosinicella sp. LHD-64]MDQ8757092.1 hypothetical protein [Sphingosinicella sp. LHD-64]